MDGWMWKSKGGCKRGNLMCNFKGQMDKGGHYHVQMKRWMQKMRL